MTRPNLQGIEIVVDGKFVWIRPGTEIMIEPEEKEIASPGREVTVDNS